MKKELKYDINETSLEIARDFTIKSNGRRFRLFLELVTSCYGNCEGCSLSFIDKKSLEPSMKIEMTKKIFDYFVPIIAAKENLLTMSLNMGTGDFFMMDNQFFNDLFKEISIFFEKLPTPRKVVSISTSLSLPEEKLKEKLAIMSNYLHPNQLALESVIDPLRLEKDYDRYLKNLRDITKIFPFYDVVLNISGALKPEHGFLWAKFLLDTEALNFDIQYAINNTNNYRVKIKKEIFDQFIINLYEGLGDKAKDLFDLSVSIPSTKAEGSIVEEMKNQAKEMINERVAVDHKGNMYPIAFGYGDILLDQRYDFPVIGNIYEPFDKTSAEKKVVDYLSNLFIQNKKCKTCEHSQICYSTGYAFYNKFSNQNKCENIGRFVFERIYEN